MQKSERFFIFSWKELLVLGLLALTIVGFFFTLGLHYGKKIHPETLSNEAPVAKLEESPEIVPSKETLDKGAQNAEPAAQDAIKTATEAAVTEANLKVDQPKPVDLPKEKVAEAPAQLSEAPGVVAAPKYAVQLGSYTSKKEAQQRITLFAKRGLKSEIRTAEVGGETRYRVVVPGFKTRALADLRGKEFKMKRKIENFVVIKAD
jgi:cell division protein FtsN